MSSTHFQQPALSTEGSDTTLPRSSTHHSDSGDDRTTNPTIIHDNTSTDVSSSEDYITGDNIHFYYIFLVLGVVVFICLTVALLYWFKCKKSNKRIFCFTPKPKQNLPIIPHPIYNSSRPNIRDIELTDFSSNYLEPSRNMVYNHTVEPNDIYESIA
jgi:hypothetical protein